MDRRKKIPQDVHGFSSAISPPEAPIRASK